MPFSTKTAKPIFKILQLYYSQALSQPIGAVVPIGAIFEDHEYQVVNNQCTPVSPGCSGELLIGGPQLSPGYLQSAENSRFVECCFIGSSCERWYKTGDLVREDSVNGLHYLGRIDQQIKVRGYRVEVREVEHVLSEISGLQQVAVIAGDTDSAGNTLYLVAFIVGDVNTNQLRLSANYQLPDYMQLERVIAINKMPLNSNGKVDYSLLSHNFRESLNAIPA